MFISKKKYEAEIAEWARKYSELETKCMQYMFYNENLNEHCNELNEKVTEYENRIEELEREIDETDTMFDSCLRKVSTKIREELENRKNRRGDTDFFFFSC